MKEEMKQTKEQEQAEKNLSDVVKNLPLEK